MKTIYCLMILLWPLMGIGQTSRPLSIGEKVPDAALNNLVNYKTSSAKLSDFKGKLVILDFMHTSCRSCLLNLLRFDSLAKNLQETSAVFDCYHSEKRNANLLSKE